VKKPLPRRECSILLFREISCPRASRCCVRRKLPLPADMCVGSWETTIPPKFQPSAESATRQEGAEKSGASCASGDPAPLARRQSAGETGLAGCACLPETQLVLLSGRRTLQSDEFSSVCGTLSPLETAAERDENANRPTNHRAVLCSHPGARWTVSAYETSTFSLHVSSKAPTTSLPP
jgi:hypothetical protein